jgi:peroxiredoxin
MKIKSHIILVLSLIIFASCGQDQSNSKAFTLKGKISGSDSKYIYLGYHDSSNVYVLDTLQIVNQSFHKNGYVNNTQMVTLFSDLAGRTAEDPNMIKFFLEPNTIELTLIEGEFDKAKIIGSKTQIEYENLDKTIKPFDEKIELIRTKIQKLNEKENESNNGDSEYEIEKLTNEWQKILDAIKNVRIQYAINNPQSYLSAYLIKIYKESVSNDSLKILYNKLEPVLKESYYGVKIKAQMELRIVNSGDLAPSFTRKDINGKELSLNQFLGTTVLLDFGAAWCLPCVKNHPELKRIYNEYHPKGLEIIGISFDKDQQIWKDNVQNEELNWHHVYEGFLKDQDKGSISKMYYVQPVPAYILINEKGIIIDRYSNADKANKSLKDLEEKLKTLLP